MFPPKVFVVCDGTAPQAGRLWQPRRKGKRHSGAAFILCREVQRGGRGAQNETDSLFASSFEARHSASKTRVNALMVRPQGEANKASLSVLAMRFFAPEVCGTARTKDAERF
jgi:hypothetical protein